MNDDLPPLVEQRPTSSWPPENYTPGPTFGNATVVPMQPPNAAPVWGGFGGGGPWVPPGALTPMFPAASAMQPWQGQSPAVTQVPIPTGTVVAQGNDDWARQREQTPGPNWKPMGKDDFPSRYTSPSLGAGALTRRASSRSRTPFSGDSSSSSRDSELSRFGPQSNSSASFAAPGLVSEFEKRPPREWRSDFSLSRARTLGSAIGSLLNISRPKSAARRGSISYPKVTLHPYLRYSANAPSMFLDLRENPLNVRFRHLGGPTNHPFFPWYIEARSSNPVGVTLQDMFTAIWHCMMTPITSEDYYNNEMDQAAREAIAIAWSERCGHDQEQRTKGVRRVDFLMEKRGLEGIAKGKDGKWELKVKKV